MGWGVRGPGVKGGRGRRELNQGILVGSGWVRKPPRAGRAVGRGLAGRRLVGLRVWKVKAKEAGPEAPAGEVTWGSGSRGGGRGHPSGFQSGAPAPGLGKFQRPVGCHRPAPGAW